MNKDIRPGMIVRHNRHSVWYNVKTWLLVTAVHAPHKDGYDEPHIHGMGLANSPSGTVLYGEYCVKTEDIAAAYYKVDSSDQQLQSLTPPEIETLLRTDITPAGCQVTIYNSDLEDRCLEVTWAEIEDKFGCKIKLKGK